jgi:hypothetical protein
MFTYPLLLSFFTNIYFVCSFYLSGNLGHILPVSTFTFSLYQNLIYFFCLSLYPSLSLFFTSRPFSFSISRKTLVWQTVHFLHKKHFIKSEEEKKTSKNIQSITVFTFAYDPDLMMNFFFLLRTKIWSFGFKKKGEIYSVLF